MNRSGPSRSVQNGDLDTCGNDATVARREVEIANCLGLHLRAADRFVKLARTFQAEIRVHFQGCEFNGKSILDLMGLAAECGTRLNLEACGDDAVAAIESLTGLILARFNENDNGDPAEAESGKVPARRAAKGAHPMMSDPSRVIVTTVDHPFHTVHALCVRHRDFPEVRSEDISAEAAAARLAERLSASLDTAPSDWRRELLERAIEDIRAFANRARS